MAIELRTRCLLLNETVRSRIVVKLVVEKEKLGQKRYITFKQVIV